MAIQPLIENQTGPYTANGAVVSNNAKANANFEELDQNLRVLPVAAGTFSNDVFARGTAKTLEKLEGLVNGSLSTGDFTLTVTSGGLSLIDAPPLNAKTALGPTWVEIPLTATLADLNIGEGKTIKSQLISSSGGAGIAEVSLRFTWRKG